MILRGSFSNTVPLEKNAATTTIDEPFINSTAASAKEIYQLYAILETVADRAEMHKNVGEQRDNWNKLLLNSINMITLTATTMAGVAATGGAGAPLLALRLSSTLLFTAATGMLFIMNKIQPSQLAEEQRNATKLFRQLQSQIQTTLDLYDPAELDVKDAMDNLLALDKAYPLPCGESPLLTGIAAAGSAFVGNGSWAAIVAVAAGALATTVNTFEHAGQVGMVVEMIETALDSSHLWRNQ
ncbi:hypothetical protein GH714_037529 [Hevea brasiliensis]|uniref:F-box protein n=1 Tax=Hevea brasiliensis TaxID=3981 RepID=A0A6A6LTB5_HEVBR|nr:hypothetical protein GH714_037529 [Hevea brasiliensis]